MFIQDLLRHPLCMALVRFKWIRYGRYVYYIQLASYAIFLACLTTYIVIAPNPADYKEYYHDDPTCGSFFSNNKSRSMQLIADKPDLPEKDAFQMITQYVLMSLVIWNIFSEIVQFIRASNLIY
jgi:hypothetical protein